MRQMTNAEAALYALQLAHNSNETPEAVVARAEAYVGFVRGTATGPSTEPHAFDDAFDGEYPATSLMDAQDPDDPAATPAD